jgi:hypothetical protein
MSNQNKEVNAEINEKLMQKMKTSEGLKLRIGGKYRMKAHPDKNVLYVHILGKEGDIIEMDSFSINDKDERIEQFYGVMLYHNEILSKTLRYPDLCVWGENGEWDGRFSNDSNAIIEEIK